MVFPWSLGLIAGKSPLSLFKELIRNALQANPGLRCGF
jgi:hypothetical protein